MEIRTKEGNVSYEQLRERTIIFDAIDHLFKEGEEN